MFQRRRWQLVYSACPIWGPNSAKSCLWMAVIAYSLFIIRSTGRRALMKTGDVFLFIPRCPSCFGRGFRDKAAKDLGEGVGVGVRRVANELTRFKKKISASSGFCLLLYFLMSGPQRFSCEKGDPQLFSGRKRGHSCS